MHECFDLGKALSLPERERALDSSCHQRMAIGRGGWEEASHSANPQGVHSPANDGADVVVSSMFPVITVVAVAGTIQRTSGSSQPRKTELESLLTSPLPLDGSTTPVIKVRCYRERHSPGHEG